MFYIVLYFLIKNMKFQKFASNLVKLNKLDIYLINFIYSNKNKKLFNTHKVEIFVLNSCSASSLSCK